MNRLTRKIKGCYCIDLITCLPMKYEESFKIIEKDLELLEQLEILKKYYPPFREFLEEMFEKGYNEDLTKIKEWLEND